MFERLFTDLDEARADTTPNISLATIEVVIVLIAECYYTVFAKQATRFYIGEDAIVPRKLAEDNTFWDYVPNNAMMIEHFVEACRAAEKRSNKGAGTKTVSNQLVVGHSSYLRQIKRGEITDCQSDKDLHWAKHAPQAKLVLAMENQHDTSLAAEKKEVLNAKQREEIKQQGKRQALVALLSSDHGGPISTTEHLIRVCNNLCDDSNRLRELLSLEIRYQKDVIGENPRLKDLYRIQYLLPSRKMQKFPPEVLKDNLLQIITPRSGAEAPIPLSVSEIEVGAELIRQKFRDYNPARREANAGYVAGDFVYCYWDSEPADSSDQDCSLWFGRIIEVQETSLCTMCKDLEYDENAVMTNNCFVINYFDKKRGTQLSYVQSDSLVSDHHTMGWQVLRKVKTTIVTRADSPVVYRVCREHKNSSLEDISKIR